MLRNVPAQMVHVACKQQLTELKIELDAANACKNQLMKMNEETGEANKSVRIKLVAIQELYKNATADIVKLKSYNEKIKHQLDDSKELITKYREDMDVIHAQVCNILCCGLESIDLT